MLVFQICVELIYGTFSTLLPTVAFPPENIERKQTTFISSKGGVVTFGPNVTFGSKSVITTGDTTIIGGTVCGPGTVKPVMDAGAGPASVRPRQVEHESQQSVVFAKSANAPCKRAGSSMPVKVLPNIESPISVAVGKNEEIVISLQEDPSIVIFNEKYEKVSEVHDDTLSHCCIAVDSSNNILAFGVMGIKKFNMSGQELLAISNDEKPGLQQLGTPRAVAIGKKEQIYIVDIADHKVHILDREFNHIKSFAEECVAFGIAVNSDGNVYVPDMENNTVWVFTSEGDALFQFGGPGRKPLPQFSLMVPMSVAIDVNNKVYVGTGMSTITVFDKDGNFQDKIGSSGSKPGQFEGCPAPLCIDNKGRLYAGDQSGDKLQIFQI